MEEYKFQIRFFWISLVLVLVLFALIIVFSLPSVNAFDMDLQTKKILLLLIPINALYLWPLLRFAVKNKNKVNSDTRKKVLLNRTFVFSASLIIVFHAIILYTLTFLSAFNFISFSGYLMLLAITETAFAGYVTFVISNIFNLKPKK